MKMNLITRIIFSLCIAVAFTEGYPAQELQPPKPIIASGVYRQAVDSYGNPVAYLEAAEAPDGRKFVHTGEGIQFEIPKYASGITEIKRPSDDLLPPLIPDDADGYSAANYNEAKLLRQTASDDKSPEVIQTTFVVVDDGNAALAARDVESLQQKQQYPIKIQLNLEPISQPNSLQTNGARDRSERLLRDPAVVEQVLGTSTDLKNNEHFSQLKDYFNANPDVIPISIIPSVELNISPLVAPPFDISNGEQIRIGRTESETNARSPSGAEAKRESSEIYKGGFGGAPGILGEQKQIGWFYKNKKNEEEHTEQQQEEKDDTDEEPRIELLPNLNSNPFLHSVQSSANSKSPPQAQSNAQALNLDPLVPPLAEPIVTAVTEPASFDISTKPIDSTPSPLHSQQTTPKPRIAATTKIPAPTVFSRTNLQPLNQRTFLNQNRKSQVISRFSISTVQGNAFPRNGFAQFNNFQNKIDAPRRQPASNLDLTPFKPPSEEQQTIDAQGTSKTELPQPEESEKENKFETSTRTAFTRQYQPTPNRKKVASTRTPGTANPDERPKEVPFTSPAPQNEGITLNLDPFVAPLNDFPEDSSNLRVQDTPDSLSKQEIAPQLQHNQEDSTPESHHSISNKGSFLKPSSENIERIEVAIPKEQFQPFVPESNNLLLNLEPFVPPLIEAAFEKYQPTVPEIATQSTPTTPTVTTELSTSTEETKSSTTTPVQTTTAKNFEITTLTSRTLSPETTTTTTESPVQVEEQSIPPEAPQTELDLNPFVPPSVSELQQTLQQQQIYKFSDNIQSNEDQPQLILDPTLPPIFESRELANRPNGADSATQSNLYVNIDPFLPPKEDVDQEPPSRLFTPPFNDRPQYSQAASVDSANQIKTDAASEVSKVSNTNTFLGAPTTSFAERLNFNKNVASTSSGGNFLFPTESTLSNDNQIPIGFSPNLDLIPPNESANIFVTPSVDERPNQRPSGSIGLSSIPFANNPFLQKPNSGEKPVLPIPEQQQQKPQQELQQNAGTFGGAPGVLGNQKPGYAVVGGSSGNAINTNVAVKPTSAPVAPPPTVVNKNPAQNLGIPIVSNAIAPPAIKPSPSAPNTSDKYTGGFGGPPGILSPFDNINPRIDA